MRLLLIRHGETEVNVQGLTHKVDDPNLLTEKGIRQSEALVQVCKDNVVKNIFSSSERRAVQTANIIAKGLGLVPIILESLRERNWGDWSGKSWSEISATLTPLSIEERYKFIPPNGESWEQMDLRLMSVLEKIIHKSHANVAVVLHEGTLRAIIPNLKGEPKESSLKYNFDNGSVTIFDYENGRYKEVKLNYLPMEFNS